LAGRLAEEIHATTFNTDAAGKGLRGLQAKTTASMGDPFAAADVVVTKSGAQVDLAQLKYCRRASDTTRKIANVKYDDMQRVVASDQVDQVRDIARRRGTDGLGRRNYPAVAEEASGSIRNSGAASTPLSHAEAIEAAANPTTAASRLVSNQVVGALKSGAVTGGLVGAGISAITNIVSVAKDEKSANAAVVDTAADTAGCAATGAAVSAAAVGAQTALARAGAGALARGSAPVAIAVTAVDIGKNAYKTAVGEIDSSELAARSAGNVATGVSTWGGMEAGAALGTLLMPGVGTIVCGVAGGIVGGVLGDAAYKKVKGS